MRFQRIDTVLHSKVVMCPEMIGIHQRTLPLFWHIKAFGMNSLLNDDVPTLVDNMEGDVTLYSLEQHLNVVMALTVCIAGKQVH